MQTYVAPKAAPKPVPPARKPVAPKVAPKPIVANVASYANSYKVQLGAFRSQADAEAQWQKIRSSHLDLLNGKPYQIVRADLGAKGIYYRLRAGGAPSEAAAKSLCKTLDARKQPCLYVGK